MYTLRDVVAAIAHVLVIPRETIENYARRLRDAGSIPKGRPGQSVELDNEGLLVLLVSVLSGARAIDAAQAATTYAELRGPGFSFGDELSRIYRQACRSAPSTADLTIELCTSWPGATIFANGVATHFVDIHPSAPRPAFERRVSIEGRVLQRIAHQLSEKHL